MNKQKGHLEYIHIKGARVNNLKNVSVDIPIGKLVAVTGVSGSGKTSLAFDTLYAEGQRRYVESLSSYARQFLGRMSKPECDFIKNLPPAIAIQQKVIARNPRSTVGTTTEIYEYLRLLYARIGHTYSPVTGELVKQHTPDDVVRTMLSLDEGTRLLLTAPFIVASSRTPLQQLEATLQQGYTRILHEGQIIQIEDVIDMPVALESLKIENMSIVIDRFSASSARETISRVTDSAETAFFQGQGRCALHAYPDGETFHFSTSMEEDGITYMQPTENLFAFNSPIGSCPTCQGFGHVIGIDPSLVIPNPALSVYDGCVACWKGEKLSMWQKEFIRRAAADDFPIFTPYRQLTKQQRRWLWEGLPSDLRHNGAREVVSINNFFQMVRANLYKIQYRVLLSRYRGRTLCPDCGGTRLRKEATYVKIDGKSINELVDMPVCQLQTFIENLRLPEHEQQIAARPLKEISTRLQFLIDTGLEYLTLNRPSNTLSGGESQRINLTTSLGSPLVGSLYVLDEPSIGLHAADTGRLIGILRKLRDEGNTVVVVEHDEDILRAADYIIDIGPDAGEHGGTIVFQGSADDVLTTQATGSHTVDYLQGRQKIDIPATRRTTNEYLIITGCAMNNLKNVTLRVPLHTLTAVTGVSGSGKTTLIKQTLHPALLRHLGLVAPQPGAYDKLEGDVDSIRHVEIVDQNPIGASTRSNAATYLKAYDYIRQLMAQQQLAKQLNITAQHFSFNTDGGRCDECKGAGVTTIEMQFMADLNLTCPSCGGKRFKREVLQIQFAGKNIDDILHLSVNQAVAFFSEQQEHTTDSATANLLRDIVDRLLPLQQVGLGYIQLGQPSSTLSGGENQRVKLAYHIAQEQAEHTLFIFDEPTTGLHAHDINRLLAAFNTLIKHGHSIIVIEHNMDVIKAADHVIDLGPRGGDAGGEIVAEGTPEEVAAAGQGLTARHLKAKLEQEGK